MELNYFFKFLFFHPVERFKACAARYYLQIKVYKVTKNYIQVILVCLSHFIILQNKIFYPVLSQLIVYICFSHAAFVAYNGKDSNVLAV